MDEFTLKRLSSEWREGQVNQLLAAIPALGVLLDADALERVSEVINDALTLWYQQGIVAGRHRALHGQPDPLPPT